MAHSEYDPATTEQRPAAAFDYYAARQFNRFLVPGRGPTRLVTETRPHCTGGRSASDLPEADASSPNAVRE